MSTNSLTIHVDRCVAAFAENDIQVRRAKALEIVSKAFGHDSSNETSAAAERGELDPPTLRLGPNRLPLGAHDGMVIVRDPTRPDGHFAVDRSTLLAGDRASSFLTSPWGTLLDARDARREAVELDVDCARLGIARERTHLPLTLGSVVAGARLARAEHLDVVMGHGTAEVTCVRVDGTTETLWRRPRLEAEMAVRQVERYGDRFLVVSETLDVSGIERPSPDRTRLVVIPLP